MPSTEWKFTVARKSVALQYTIRQSPMSGLYTNSKQRRDFIRNELQACGERKQRIYIASAFFTESDVLEEMARTAESILLVVRLGFPTSPGALARALKLRAVKVRYYSHHSFHPKLYIFGDERALVGSANLTGAAISSNQEIVISVDAEDDRFSDLQQLFASYWEHGRVLTPETLDHYRASYAKHAQAIKDIEELEKHVESTIGVHAFPNIDRGTAKPSHENIYLEDYRRTYQETTDAFQRLRETYAAIGKRKFPAETYPLRLEIDLLINHVRDVYAKESSWEQTSLGWDEVQERHFTSIATDWLSKPLIEFEDWVAHKSYPRLRAAFASKQHLLGTTDDDLFESLQAVHSFRDRLRYHKGGTQGLREYFLGNNEPQRIRSSLAHLVFGQGDVVARMGDLIFNQAYKLQGFGRANVQELIGWLNQDDLPSINGRTTKVLRYFGFDIRQLSSK